MAVAHVHLMRLLHTGHVMPDRLANTLGVSLLASVFENLLSVLCNDADGALILSLAGLNRTSWELR